MADEYVRTIKIETSGAETTVRDLKNEINSLRDALLNAEKGSDEYRDILEQLIKDQERLTDAMNAGKNGMKAAEGSYNSLVNKMAALKKVWRETADETERNKIGDQIKGIQDKLKGMDGSIGDFRRNVGNYANSIKEAFGAMGGAAKGMVGPINSVKAAFTGLSAHPLVAVLTALAALLVGGITKGFKSSEEATNKLRVAFSGFQAIGDAVTKMFQGLAKIIGDVANGVVNFADKLGLLGPKFKARQEMTKKQIELEKKERDSITKTAQIEQEAADLREKASDEENYSISQRIEFLKQAQAKEEEGLQLEKEILEQKVNQLEAQLALTDSTGEELTKLNELKAKLIKVNSDIAKSQTSANKEINALRKRGVQEAAQAQQQLLSLEKELLQQEYDLAVDGSEKQLKLAREIAAKDREIAISNAKAKIKDKETLNKQLLLIDEKYQNDLRTVEFDYINKVVEQERSMSQLRANAYNRGTVEYMIEVKKGEEKIHALYESIVESGGDLTSDLVQAAFGQFNKTEIEELYKDFEEVAKKFGEETDEQQLKLTQQLGENTLNKIKLMASESMINLKDLADAITDIEQTTAERVNQLILESTMPMSKYYREQYNQLSNFLEGQDKIVKKYSESDEEYQLRLNALIKERTNALVNYRNAVQEELDTYKRYEAANYEYYQGRIGLMERLKVAVKDSGFAIRNQENSLKDYVTSYSNILSKQISDYINDIEKTYGSGAADVFKSFWDGAVPTPEVLKKKIEENFEVTVGQIANMGLFPKEVFDPYLASLESAVDAEEALLNQRRENWLELSNNIADLMGGIGNVWENSLEIRKKTLEKEGKYNKMEQKSLEQSYENLRLLKIAEATVNTISGAIAAYMKCQELGQPWGTVLGAIQAAVVTATGVAEIGKLKHMDNPYADNSSVLGGSAGGGMSATVIPQVSDYTPDYGVNLTNREDTEYLQEAIGRQRIWVSVSEIDRVQNRVNVAEKEAQF